MPKEIKVVVIGDTKQYEAAMASAGAETEKLGGHTSKASSAVKAAHVALAGFAGILYESTKAALDGQASQAQFDQAVKNSHVSVSQSTEALDKNSASAAKLGYNEDQVRQAYSQALLATKDNTKATNDLQIAENLAVAQHESLSAATKQVILGYQGSARAAKQMGIAVPAATDHAAAATARLKAENISTTSAVGKHIMAQAALQDKLETGQKVMEQVRQKVNGMGQAYANTAQGKMAAMHAQFQNLEESMGNVFLPILEKLMGVLGSFAAILEKHKTIVMTLVIAIGALAVAMEVAAGIQKVMVFWTESLVPAWQALDAAMEENPIGAVIVAIIALIAIFYELYQHVTFVRNIINEAWNFIKTATVTVWDFIKDHIKTIIEAIIIIITGPIGALAILLYTYWGTIKSDLMTAWNAIKSFFDTVLGLITTAIETPINTIRSWLQTMWINFKSDVTSAWNQIKTAFDTVMQLIKSAIETPINTVKSDLKQAWNDIKTTATTFFGNLPGDITNAIGGLGKTLYSKGQDLLNGLMSGISNGWSTVSTFFKNLGSKIAGFFTGAAKWLVSQGGSIASGLLTGIKNGLANVGKDIVKWIEALLPSASGIVHDIGHALHIPGLATGGIVTSPTLAVIGEAGPEAVVPLTGVNTGSQVSSLPIGAPLGGGSSGGNIYVTVQAPALIGTGLQQAAAELTPVIRRELLKIQKRNNNDLGFTNIYNKVQTT